MITPGTILILAVIVGVPTLIVMGCIIVGMGKPKSFGGSGEKRNSAGAPAPQVGLGGPVICGSPPPTRYGDIRDSCERKIREKLKEIKRKAQ